jgi:hypothetical protein
MVWYKNKKVKKVRRILDKKLLKPYVTGNPKRTRKARMNLYSEIAAIKKVINVEKKVFNISYTSNLGLGQVIGNSAGWYIADITPNPAQGITESTRNGASIKLTGSRFNFCFQQQSGATTAIKVRIMIIHITGKSMTPSDWVNTRYELNQFVLNAGAPSIIDYNSQLDLNGQGGFKILRTTQVYLKQDNYSGLLTIKNFSMGLKYNNHHVRYNGNGITPQDGQILMFFQPDVGNASSTTACTLSGVPATAINTGCTVNYNIQHYFVDN